jgi:hypothetical protein
VDVDLADDSFGICDAECIGCDSFLRVNDIGLCVDCSAKCERDLLRMRDWAYAASAFGLSLTQRNELRDAVIRRYGKANELLAPTEGAPSRRRRRGTGRPGPGFPKGGHHDRSR